jgi:hypothetical protein
VDLITLHTPVLGFIDVSADAPLLVSCHVAHGSILSYVRPLTGRSFCVVSIPADSIALSDLLTLIVWVQLWRACVRVGGWV